MKKPVRPTEKTLEKLEMRERFLLRQIRRSKLMEDGRKSEFWKEIRGMAKEKLDAVEQSLDVYRKFSHDEIIAFLEARVQLKHFISMPEDFAASIDQFSKELAAQQQQTAEYKMKLRRANGE